MVPIPEARSPRPRATLPALAACLLVASCAAPTPPTPIATDATTVTVTMTEFQLVLNPSTLTAGSYRFHAVNAGRTAHSLVLTGPGLTEQRTAVLPPGQSGDVTAALTAGEYDLYCPIDDHRARGMEVRVAVTA